MVIFILEMSVPWIEKSSNLPLIIDNLGGYSRDLIDSSKELIFDNKKVDTITHGK